MAIHGDDDTSAEEGNKPGKGFLSGLFGGSSSEEEQGEAFSVEAENPADPGTVSRGDDKDFESGDLSEPDPDQTPARVYTRDEHDLSRKQIDRDALKALYRLHDHGYKAYLVGGAVRDLLIGKAPKDFDIATSATPQQVKRLFRNCRIIGRRFRLAHLYYGRDKILEVATFRSSGGDDEVIRDGELIRRDNVYGTPEEDARRRDLTINGLFYDIGTFSILDYVGGVTDLRQGVVRMIGDPQHSFREDPVRLLRAIRHSTRLGFRIGEETLEALIENRDEILKANRARLLEEFLKDLVSGRAAAYFQQLLKLGFLELLIPDLHERLEEEGEESQWLQLLERVDAGIAAGEPIRPHQALAALIGPFVREVYEEEEVAQLKAFRDRKAAFRELTQPVLRQLKVYKKDEDRLWSAMGGLHRVSGCDSWEELPTSLEGKHWLRDSLQVLHLLHPQQPGVREWLIRSRKMDLEDPPELTRKRRRPRRGQGRGPGRRSSHSTGEGGNPAENSSQPGDSAKSESAGAGRRRRRRRRRPRKDTPNR